MLEVYQSILSITDAPKLELTFDNQYLSGTYTIIDLTWYVPYKALGDNIICMFMYFCFVVKIFKNLANIVSGVGSASNSLYEPLERERFLEEHSTKL